VTDQGAGPATLLLPSIIFFAIAVGYLLPENDAVSAAEVNQSLPIALGVTCAVTAVRLLRYDHLMIWSPLFWFLCVSVLYYSIGPLLYYFGNAESIAYTQLFYWCDERTLLKANFLNAMCISVVYTVGSLGLLSLRTSHLAKWSLFTRRDRDRFLWFTLIVGCPIRYILAPMNQWLDKAAFIPQQFLIIGDLVYVSIYLLVYGFVRGERSWSWILVPLLAWELVFRVLGGSKLGFFLFGLSAFMGVYVARPTFRIIALGVVAAVPAYFVMTEITNVVRATTSGEWRQSTLSSRAESVLEFAGNLSGPTGGRENDIETRWVRLAYWSAQAYCINRYDTGYQSKSLEMFYWSFLPRALFPNKPDMSFGIKFNMEVTGYGSSQSSPGFFAEAYWSGGYELAVGLSAYVGLLFAVMSRLALTRLRQNDYRWLPLLWCGVVAGLRPDDWFIATYVASIPLAMATCVPLFLLMTPSRPMARKST
jgi:hypothetical protein